MSDLTPEVGAPAWIGWLAGALAALAMVLALADIGLRLAVNADQRHLEALRAYNAATPEIVRIDNTLIRTLAVMAASKGDDRIKQLLAGAGIHYKLTKPAPKP